MSDAAVVSGNGTCRVVLPVPEDDRRLQSGEARRLFWGRRRRRRAGGSGQSASYARYDWFFGAFSGRRRRGGCFPADTTVTANGVTVPIQNLSVGDVVLGSDGLSPFHLQGHADANEVTTMVKVETLNNRSVMASPDHYFPLASGGHSKAEALAVGDFLWVQEIGETQNPLKMVSSPIVSTSLVTATGLFNPYTQSGNLFVNGILASCHSSWFLEGSGLTDSSIVRAYSALFSPLNALYDVKPHAFRSFHDEIGLNGRALSAVSVVDILVAAFNGFAA